MATAENLELTVSTDGQVPAQARERVAEKVNGLLGHVRDPILYADVRLTQESNPGQDRPAIAEATLSVNGTPVRSHVAAADMDAAIDLLEERLRRRISRHEQRLHRDGKERHRNAGTSEGEWRHGDLPTQRPEWFQRPRDEREVIRNKTFALEPMTTDEAAFDLDSLGHDFYLFTEIRTGTDGVIFFDSTSGLTLQLPEGADGSALGAAAVPVELAPPAPTLSLKQARERLEDGGEPFVFYVDVNADRGRVLYHRYDGHYGLILSAD